MIKGCTGVCHGVRWRIAGFAMMMGIVMMLSAPPARAFMTGYDTQAGFDAASTTNLINFEAFSNGTLITNQLPGISSVTGRDGPNAPVNVFVTSDATLPFPMFVQGTLPSGTNFLSNDLSDPHYATGSITFQLTSPGTAIGAYVADGAPLDGFSIELFDGINSLGSITVGPRNLPDAFVGVVSTQAFTSAKFFSVSAGDSWGLDDLKLATTAPVPEPGSLALLGLGVAGLLGLSLLRSRSKAGEVV
jgi:hypothetical protein